MELRRVRDCHGPCYGHCYPTSIFLWHVRCPCHQLALVRYVYIINNLIPTTKVSTFRPTTTDSAYTERYMSVPTSKQTLANYFKSSLLNKALNISGKKFLLVHGSADGKF